MGIVAEVASSESEGAGAGDAAAYTHVIEAHLPTASLASLRSAFPP